MSASENAVVGKTSWLDPMGRRRECVVDGCNLRSEKCCKHLPRFLGHSRTMNCIDDDQEFVGGAVAADGENVGAEFPSHGKSLDTMG